MAWNRGRMGLRAGAAAALLGFALAGLPGCQASQGAPGDDVAWGTMGHGGRQSRRDHERMLWSLAVRAPDVLLEIDGRRVLVKDALGGGVLRYALRDEVLPRIWLELPDGVHLDWTGLELAADAGAWLLDREGRYELRLGAAPALEYVGL